MRWRILDKTGGHMCYKPQKVAKITVCCMMLHNLCRRLNLTEPLLEMENDVTTISTMDYENDPDVDGSAKRERIVNTF